MTERERLSPSHAQEQNLLKWLALVVTCGLVLYAAAVTLGVVPRDWDSFQRPKQRSAETTPSRGLQSKPPRQIAAIAPAPLDLPSPKDVVPKQVADAAPPQQTDADEPSFTTSSL